MQKTLKLLLQEIDKCYQQGNLDLLEAKRLENIESKIKTELADIVNNLDDEILLLKFKKLKNGWTTKLKSGFHNSLTVKSKLEPWKNFINEILNYINTSTKTFKNRLEAEGLFIESRSKEGDDIHLIIGKKDGNPDKAHAVVDEKTGEIRVEDNQLEPLELVQKIESVITLPTGKKVRITRESIEEIVEDPKDNKQQREIDQRRAGVIDEGIDTTFIDCEGVGPDAGLISKGKGMKSINSKWRTTDNK